MQQDKNQYEKKVIQNKEFPIQILINKFENLKSSASIFRAHWHEHIELHYIISGKMELMLDQKDFFVVEEGNLVVINGNVLHEGTCSGDLLALVIIFNMDDLTKELADKNIVFQEMILQDAYVQRALNDFYQEYAQKELGYCLACKGILLQLISYLSRNYAHAVLTEKESVKHLKKLERLNIVRQYIEKHYAEPISNKELAELIHLSEDRFNHLFKECMSVSPLQYMNEIRLEKAMHLLKAGVSPTEAAGMAGFSDYNYFGRVFRRKFGYPPGKASEQSTEKLIEDYK